jgi:hypothetical protein
MKGEKGMYNKKALTTDRFSPTRKVPLTYNSTAKLANALSLCSIDLLNVNRTWDGGEISTAKLFLYRLREGSWPSFVGPGLL